MSSELAPASLTFYAYWNVDLLPVIRVSITSTFFFALATAAYSRYSPVIFTAAAAANLAALGFYKYDNFTIEIFNTFPCIRCGRWR